MSIKSENPRVHLAHQEAEQLVPKMQVRDEASTLIGSSEVRQEMREMYSATFSKVLLKMREKQWQWGMMEK